MSLDIALMVLGAAGLAMGLGLRFAGEETLAQLALYVAIVPSLVVLAAKSVRDALRGRGGVDVLAIVAMLGAVVLDELVAGAVIALMYASGRSLEGHARRRARRALTRLLEGVPTLAHRYDGDGLTDVAVDRVRPGDRLMVPTGEVVAVDGMIVSGSAVVDESALTGEALPVRIDGGGPVSSGAVNSGPPFDMVAAKGSVDSAYHRIVRLVEGAQASKAPFVRLADRYALLFVPVALAVAAAAWLISGDPVRALAVVVVATPCPLLLAAPVAIISGIARAARRGVLVKDAGALETLARARVLLFDKTGTLTTGSARLVRIETAAERDAGEVLRLAASLEQASPHVMAKAIVAAGRERGAALALPRGVREAPGAGIAGEVDGHQIAVGGHGFVSSHAQDTPWAQRVLQRASWEGAGVVFVAVDGVLTGALLMADEVRVETPAALRKLRRAGIRRVVMVTGDRADVAESVGAALGVDAVLAERSPEDKVDAVASERLADVTVMVGDGVNDAPALAAADVGVAMGARGSGASAEAGDVVLLVDRLDRLAEALQIARRSRAIATQSVVAGMGLSFVGMGAAAFGYLPPVAGAIAQEVIDVVVILNALRALGAAPGERPGQPLPGAMIEGLLAEHRRLAPTVERLFTVADRLDTVAPGDARRDLAALDTWLREHLVPHEAHDDRALYPELAQRLGGDDPLASLSRAHREIIHLARRYQHRIETLPETGPGEEDVRELRRLLYGLGAVLRLHMAQEEELFEMMRGEG